MPCVAGAPGIGRNGCCWDAATIVWSPGAGAIPPPPAAARSSRNALPARLTVQATDVTTVAQPTNTDRVAMLQEAAETHRVFQFTDGADEDSASWYADWLLDHSELSELLGARPVRSHLVHALVQLERDHADRAAGTDEPWPAFYARRQYEPFGQASRPATYELPTAVRFVPLPRSALTSVLASGSIVHDMRGGSHEPSDVRDGTSIDYEP
jgi:hypothetical protein